MGLVKIGLSDQGSNLLSTHRPNNYVEFAQDGFLSHELQGIAIIYNYFIHTIKGAFRGCIGPSAHVCHALF